MDVHHHPAYDRWLESVTDEDALLDVYALEFALVTHGMALGEPEAKAIVATRDLYELRRTPPSMAAPYAVGTPVLRMLYAFFRSPTGPVVAYMLHGGDRTVDGSQWYGPAIVAARNRVHQAERQLGYQIINRR
ncbi:MAG: hypothetical protein ACYCV7_10030 [Acidimicrobiales bacterium]